MEESKKKNKSIAIITHCYAETLDQYAMHLQYQIASLFNNPVDGSVTLYVCMTPTDRDVSHVLNMFRMNPAKPNNLTIIDWKLEKKDLFRRAIGRNLVSKAQCCDVVWYTDVDYLFGKDCLNGVLDVMGPDSLFSAPNTVKINNDHATGDEMVDSARRGQMNFDEAKFSERRQKVVIGGVQLVGGNHARKFGYLDGTKWCKPVDAGVGFRTCKCDVHYRRWIKQQLEQDATVRFDTKNLYRIRHTENGRDFNGAGENLGRRTW